MEITQKIIIPEFLSGGGEMGERIRNFDWTETPLGEPKDWSQSLQSTISIILANRFPMALWWGDELIQFYNDPYIAIPGLKHPKALGQSGSECWAEIWNVVGPLIETPFNGGPATWMDDILLEMNRKNFVEETHFTVAYSPVPDNTAPNGIGGVLGIANEIGPKIIGERRIILLRDLATTSAKARTTGEACSVAAETLSNYLKDIPFALFYLLTEEKKQAHLVAATGVGMNEDISPMMIDLSSSVNETDNWNLFEALQSEKLHVVNDLNSHFKKVPQGPWSDAPHSAAVIPVRSNKAHDFVGFLICGISSRLRFDDQYQGFFGLLSSQISSAIATANTLEEERKRAEALAEIDKAKTVFFNNISHEFRTPLTLMLGPLEELMRQPQNEISEQNLSSIQTTHRNAMRLLKLVNTLLDFSLIESGRQQANFTLVDITAFTKNLASSFRSVIEKARLRLIVNADAILQPVYVDKQMWEKIVFNLLSNAFKYTLSGSISVNLFSENNKVVLQITDTGAGIPKKELPHMFERFHRVQGVAGRTYERTGIGLSMIKELIRLHGGTIDVESKEGKGSTFTVTIPTGKEHLPSEQLAPKEKYFEEVISNVYVEEATTLLENISAKNNKIESVTENGKGNAKTSTILIVDDNGDMREYIKTLLEKNYNIITANNGMDAMHKVNEQQPTLILSDIMMPVMDGLQLLKEVKQNPQTSHIPVILLSARAGEEATIQGYDIGADDYLIKPFSAKELTARIRSQLKITLTRRHAEQQLKNLFLQAPIAICILRGHEYIIEVANEKALEFWSKKAEQVMNKPVFEVMPDAKGQGLEELLDNVYKTGKRFVTTELPINLIRNGTLEKVFVKFVYEALYEEGGTISGVMVLVDEITEQVIAKNKNLENQQLREKELEEKVQQRTLELGEANELLQEKNQELAQMNKELESFAYISSHDLQEPLRKIQTFASRVLETEYTALSDKGKDYFHRMQDSARRMQTLIQDLLSYSRTANVERKFEKTNLNKVVEEVKNDFEEIIHEKNATIEAHDLCEASIIPFQFHQMMFNLIGNSLKFSNPGKPPHIIIKSEIAKGSKFQNEDPALPTAQAGLTAGRLSSKKNYCHITISDNGIGFEPQYKDKIFEVFQRLYGRDEYPGTGIGLSIVKKIVENHNGIITATGELNKGATFDIYIPA